MIEVILLFMLGGIGSIIVLLLPPAKAAIFGIVWAVMVCIGFLIVAGASENHET